MNIIAINISSQTDWVSDCCLMPNEQFVSYIINGGKFMNNEELTFLYWQSDWIEVLLT
jgi:hypothetical protein